MSAKQAKTLSATRALKRCAKSEVTRARGARPSTDARLFLGLGQERFEHALNLFVEMSGTPYNLFVSGISGKNAFGILEGRLRKALKDHAVTPDLRDVCYVPNFKNPKSPKSIFVPKGRGEEFRLGVWSTFEKLEKAIPHEMNGPAFAARAEKAERPFKEFIQATIEHVHEIALAKGLGVSGTLEETEFYPTLGLIEELTGTSLEGLNPKERQERIASILTPSHKAEVARRQSDVAREVVRWHRETNNTQQRIHDLGIEKERALRDAKKEIIEGVIRRTFEDSNLWSINDATRRFRDELLEHVIENHEMFLEEEKPQNSPFMVVGGKEEKDTRPFKVKVFVNRSGHDDFSICASPIATLGEAIGNVGHAVVIANTGKIKTDLYDVAAGKFHGAECIIVSAYDAFTVRGLYEVIKGIAKSGEVPVGKTPNLPPEIEAYLQPEPVASHPKIIIFGPSWLMQVASWYDSEFSTLFRYRGDVLPVVKRTKEQVGAYGSYIEELPGYDPDIIGVDGICALIEHMGRLAGDQEHLSINFAELEAILREAYLLKSDPTLTTGRARVQKAIQNIVFRASASQENRLAYAREGILLISTEGKEVGQVNGLAVSKGYDEGFLASQIEGFCSTAAAPFNRVSSESIRKLAKMECAGGAFATPAECAGVSFGFPTRITACAFPGKYEVVNVMGEVGQAGPSYRKADLIVASAIQKFYGIDGDLLAKLVHVMEQAYWGVDGDSASQAEFMVLLSAIGKIPIRQDLALTGSLNMKGEIQPIGGVNHKVEGWYDVCLAKGPLTGTQGVVIPYQNIGELMLREDVVQAMKDKKFFIYPVHDVDELKAVMTGLSAADFDKMVEKGRDELRDKVKKLNAFLKGDK